MEAFIGLGILFGLACASMSVLHLTGTAIHPGEKRTYLFETEDGDRYNPFSDAVAAPESTPRTCGWCGTAIDDADYTYCRSCTRRLS